MKSAERDISIDIIKTVAMFLIIQSHVAYHSGLVSNSFELNNVLSSLFSYCGQIGNVLFIFASAYYISDKFKVEKILKLIFTTGFYSYLYLGVLFCLGYKFSMNLVLKSLFPVTFASNWFVTAYLIFLLFVPYLSKILLCVQKKEHLYIACVWFLLYAVIPTCVGKKYCYSDIFGFILIYFVVKYYLKYVKNSGGGYKHCLSKLKNICLIISIAFFAFLVCVIYLECRGVIGSGNRFIWLFFNSVPVLACSYCLVFFVKWFVNYNFKRLQFLKFEKIAARTLGIYLIHENVLMNTLGIYEILYNLLGSSMPIGVYYIVVPAAIYVVALFVDTLFYKVYSFVFDKYILCCYYNISKKISSRCSEILK